MIDQIIQDYDF